MVFMSLPAGQLGSYQACQAGSVDFEILDKGIVEKGLFLCVLNIRMPEIEPILSVGIGMRELRRIDERFLCFMLFIQWRT